MASIGTCTRPGYSTSAHPSLIHLSTSLYFTRCVVAFASTALSPLPTSVRYPTISALHSPFQRNLPAVLSTVYQDWNVPIRLYHCTASVPLRLGWRGVSSWDLGKQRNIPIERPSLYVSSSLRSHSGNESSTECWKWVCTSSVYLMGQ
jgi:hypothetical protein